MQVATTTPFSSWAFVPRPPVRSHARTQPSSPLSGVGFSLRQRNTAPRSPVLGARRLSRRGPSPLHRDATILQGNALNFSLRIKSSSRTNCPNPAHPASRIFPDDRVTLIHGARRQIETQKKEQNSPHTSLPPRHPNPCPSLLTLLTSPKMTINLAPSRRSPLLPYNGSWSRKPCYSAVFLIANARLRLRLSHRKLIPLEFPNRERMAILHPVSEAQRCLASRQLSRRTHRRRFANRPPCRRFTKPGFLIVTQGLEIPLKRVKTTSSKFLIATTGTFIFRPVAWNSPPSLRSPNLNLGQRNELRLQWHRHSCLCSDDLQPTTSNHHPRPHFTFATTQPDPRLQSNSQDLCSPNFNLGQRNELRLQWHRHSCLCSDDLQPTTSNQHPRPHFTCTSTQPDPRLQSNFRELRAPNFNLGQRNELRLQWHRHSCLCSNDLQPTTSTHHPRPHFTFAPTQPNPQLQSNFREQADAA